MKSSKFKAVIASLFLFGSLNTYALSSLNSGGGGGDDSGLSGGGRSFNPLNESNKVKECEEFLQKDWNAVNDSGEPYFQQINASSNHFEQIVEHFSSSGGEGLSLTGEGGEGVEFNADHARTYAAHFFHLAVCQAYLVSFDKDNYGANLEQFSDYAPHSSSLGGQGLECTTQPTPEAQQQCLAQSQGQEGNDLTCENQGPETHDFIPCKRIINFIDGFAIGKQAMQVQQTFRAGAQQLESQEELARLARTEEGIQITDSMGAQRDSLEKQGNLAYEMAAFDAAQAGTLMAMIASFPKPSRMIDDCKSKLTADEIEAGLQGRIDLFVTSSNISNPDDAKRNLMGAIQESFSLDPKDVCDFAISTRHGQNHIFKNQEVIERVKGIAIRAGIEALANGAKGALLHKQAGLVEDAMKDVEEFEPPEFPVAEAPEATTSICLVDPEAEGCLAPNAGGFEGFNSGGFSATMGGAASLGNNTEGGSVDDDTSSNGVNNTDRDLLPTDFGVVQGSDIQRAEFEDGPVAAGSIKTGEASAGGGGAAGGAAGGGGLGGGGGSNREPASKKPSGTSSVAIKTTGSGIGGIGGRGAIGASKAKPQNPFKGLLGKKDATKGNDSLNFKGQIGKQSGSIFDMITNRYGSAISNNRLLKYEKK